MIRRPKRKIIRRKCIARAKTDSILSEDFRIPARTPRKCQPKARDQNVCGKTISTNNRNAFRAARYGRDTRNLINRRTGSPHRPIIRKTFRSRLYKRLEKFTPTHRHDTCTILKSLSNIVLYIES